jgi:hypothetical protein
MIQSQSFYCICSTPHALEQIVRNYDIHNYIVSSTTTCTSMKFLTAYFNFPVEIKGKKDLVQCISLFQWKKYPMAYTYVSYVQFQ